MNLKKKIIQAYLLFILLGIVSCFFADQLSCLNFLLLCIFKLFRLNKGPLFSPLLLLQHRLWYYNITFINRGHLCENRDKSETPKVSNFKITFQVRTNQSRNNQRIEHNNKTTYLATSSKFKWFMYKIRCFDFGAVGAVIL